MNDLKYNVGDKVRIRPDLSESVQYGGVGVNEFMTAIKGNYVRIIRKMETSYYISPDNAGQWYWTDEMLEPAPSLTKESKRKIITNSNKLFELLG